MVDELAETILPVEAGLAQNFALSNEGKGNDFMLILLGASFCMVANERTAFAPISPGAAIRFER